MPRKPALELEELLETADLARKRGDFENAAGLYEQILGRQASCKNAAAGLGICLQKLGRNGVALPYLAKVASEGSDDADLFTSLGNCYFSLGKMDVAANAFRRAVGLDPGSGKALVLLSHALVKLGEAKEAEGCLRQAIDLEPGLASAYDLMAFLLPQMGRFDEAKEFARKASGLEPNNPAYCVRFVYGGKVAAEDHEFVDRLEAMARTDSLSVPDRIRVEYGLGKAKEDLGDFGASLRHYVEANTLAGKEMNRFGQRFDPAAHTHEIDYLIRTFSRSELRSRAAFGSKSELPVFIVGMMRSGTTLTEQILSSHPEVGGAGELDYWIQAAPRTLNASPSTIEAAVLEYIRLLQTACPGKARVCDKMPQNYMSLGPIHAALPNARIIHCRRDPRDTCLSIFTIPFTHHPPFAYSLKNIAFAYRHYQKVMAHWREVLPAERFLEIDYEALVADQEGVSRRMIEFLGLEWNDSCLAPERNSRIVNTPSRWQVRQKVYDKSMGRWKRFAPWLEQLDDWGLINDL